MILKIEAKLKEEVPGIRFGGVDGGNSQRKTI